MPVSITSVTDKNGNPVKSGELNEGLSTPLTITGKAQKHHLIALWVNKELQTTFAPSVENGSWSHQFTPKDNNIDLVVAEFDYFSASNGTFKATYK